PDQSLHSACRRALRSKAVLELTLIVLSGEERGVFGFGFCGGCCPHPSPLPGGEGADRVVLPLYIDLKLRVELEF
ncbi:hypothetical protein COC44_30250, partial [Bacillus cereus]